MQQPAAAARSSSSIVTNATNEAADGRKVTHVGIRTTCADGNGQAAESEQHVVHLLPAERELLSECHRHQVYLAVCGKELPVAELQSSSCEAGCELMITYCVECLHYAAGCNADAGLGDMRHPTDPPVGGLMSLSVSRRRR